MPAILYVWCMMPGAWFLVSYNNCRYNREKPKKNHLLRLFDAKCRSKFVKRSEVWMCMNYEGFWYFSIYLRIYSFFAVLNIYISLTVTATIATLPIVTYLCIPQVNKWTGCIFNTNISHFCNENFVVEHSNQWKTKQFHCWDYYCVYAPGMLLGYWLLVTGYIGLHCNHT